MKVTVPVCINVELLEALNAYLSVNDIKSRSSFISEAIQNILYDDPSLDNDVIEKK